MPQQHIARGGLVNLLRVAMEESLEQHVRQVAAITLKNAVKKDWEHRGKPKPNSIRFSTACSYIDFPPPLSYTFDPLDVHFSIQFFSLSLNRVT